jgi:hypothetical protein
MGWSGVENGELLSRAAADGFDALITKDNGMPYEQNAAALPCAIIVLEAKSNELGDIRPLVPALLQQLANLQPRAVVRVRVNALAPRPFTTSYDYNCAE